MKPSEILEKPLALPSGLVLPSRLAKSAMSEQLGTADGRVTPALERLYERWGRGGAGLLITGNVMVDRTALEQPGNVIIEDDRDLAALKSWAAATQKNGAVAWMQINHPGRQSPRHVTPRPVAPSVVSMEGMGGLFAEPRALEAAEVPGIVARFATAAAVARAAGFAGVQIHGAHGYLVSQFLSPHTNRREDEWGGTPEKRRRFLVEIVRAVRAATGPRFPIGVKLNSADFQRGGFGEDESLDVVRALDAEGIDLLEISGGTYERAAMWGDKPPEARSTQAREAYFLEFAQKVRAVTRMPLLLTGGFRTAAGMAEAISSGAIDVAGLARPLAVEPDLFGRLISGEAERARPIELRTGLRRVDALIEGTWYLRQIRRMGQGLEPKPCASRAAAFAIGVVGSSRVDLQACKLEYSIVSPK